jgi:hypothetical protein
MNKHQENLVQYLTDYADYFVETLMASQTQAMMFIQEVFPLISDFLEKSIKRELDQYAPKSPGYNRLVDMLIELKITPDDSEVAQKLITTINGVYRN